MVLAALAVSGYLAASARVPASVPDFALRAAAVYQLEVGAACFAVFYLAAMAFTLALDGRGFAEFGTRGLRATRVTKGANREQAMLTKQIELNHEIKERLQQTDAAIRSAVETLNRQETRLARLEEEQQT